MAFWVFSHKCFLGGAVLVSTLFSKTYRNHYILHETNLQQAFSIERQTGIIRVAKQLDYDLSTEGIRQYHLVVQAHDGKYSNDTNVRINVLNVNDMKPRFGKDKYEITLNEEEVKEHPIFKVK